MFPRTLRQCVRTTRVGVQVPRLSVVPQAAFRLPSLRYNTTKAEETAKDVKDTTGEAQAEEGSGDPAENAEPSEIDILNQKLTEKDKALAEMKNHYARAIADFRNLQETTKKEVQKSKDFALQKFSKDLLESIDNFNLALSSVKEETLGANAEMKNLFDGVSMTRNVFEKTLEKHGIVKVDPVGEPFDPNQHEAVFEVPQPDKEPGTVFHVQQPGYTLNSRVLRPAKVGLVKGDN